MDEKQKREYQTVVLAGLLHDIGKFLNRADVKRKHPLFSADYVSSDEFKKRIGKDWVDFELLKILVQRHHEYYKMPDELLVQKIEDPHTRALAYIVSRADNYSSMERLNEEPSELDFKNARLRSILTRVDIEKGQPIPQYYNIQKLSPGATFPVSINDLSQLSYSYEKLHGEFGKSFLNFLPNDFDSLFNGYLSLFEEFLWCVPSDTRDKFNDISLYDHLSTTSAIAACLYHHHCNNLNESDIKNDSLNKFMLIAGDLSGIQKFIFEIGSSNPKKLSKILRGRSFYLSLLTEVASIKILRRLDLPISCRIMNAGGRFVLIVPNTPFANEEVVKLQKEIDTWFYQRFLGKLSLNIAYGVTLSGEDFSSARFSQKYKELGQAVELSKKKRFLDIVMNNEGMIDGAMQKAFASLQRDKDACEFCKIYPMERDEKRCQMCTDSEKLGEELVSQPFLYLYDVEGKGDFDLLGYSLSFKSRGDEWILLEKIGDEESNKNEGFIRRYISNYIPEKKDSLIDLNNEHPDEGNTLCRYCGSPCKLEKNDKEGIPPRRQLVSKYLTFQCISASTVRNNEGIGVDHLAVIKADVDDLGFIFHKGLGEAFSISRYASLSRMLNYFFTGWLIQEIKEHFPMTYTVYAGGDDLLLITPWEDALMLGSQIGMKFKSFVGGNANLTISMGINLMRPGSPVKLATKGADDNLNKSKEADEKSSITVFNTTVPWDELPVLEKFMSALNNAFIKEEVNTSFLYRLLKYHEMYLSSERGIIEGLKFHSLMTRDVRRNIEKKDKSGSIINQSTINILSPLYMVGKEFDKNLMRNLKVPVFWTLYKNRGGGR
ncbi:MAG TPA: type III-A CRISPR-associated protein Cas10/Csm1 [Candidatus Wunengus sp. YC61]|uniref:type III-A CRISPR-associated protein Cas10/Csm1 n=1 Tax=Candidatus Wunengus sp. YC61 TaxID=3367698 RepID=UPI004026B433